MEKGQILSGFFTIGIEHDDVLMRPAKPEFRKLAKIHNMDLLKYGSVDNLLKGIEKAIINPALEMGEKLLIQKTEEIRSRHINDYI